MQETRLILAARLADGDLIRRTHELATRERGATADLVAHLAELDQRKLYLAEGHGSLFSYCTQVLGLAEHAAYNRIEAARASRRFPTILERLADGSLNLSTVRLLAAHLTLENHERVLAAAAFKSKREIECLVAGLAPRPDVAATIRRVPALRAPEASCTGNGSGRASTRSLGGSGESRREPTHAAEEASRGLEDGAPVPGPAIDRAAIANSLPPMGRPTPPAPSHTIAPLSPERYRIQFTVSRETHDQLRQAQALLRREIPDGDPAAIFGKALELLVEDVARRKLAAVSAPRSDTVAKIRSRHVPARVRREVWRRDGGRCAFHGRNGRRCNESVFLEFHHVEPYCVGGETTTANLSLRCRAHNAYEYQSLFGASSAPEGSPDSLARTARTRPGAG